MHIYPAFSLKALEHFLIDVTALSLYGKVIDGDLNQNVIYRHANDK